MRRDLWLYHDRVEGSSRDRDALSTEHWNDDQICFRPELAIKIVLLAHFQRDCAEEVEKRSIAERIWDGRRFRLPGSTHGTGAAAVGPAATRTNWSPPSLVALSQAGFVIWHINIAYVAERNEYWAVCAACRPADGCGKCELYLAQSSDGETWSTSPGPFFHTGVSSWSDASLYAASFVFKSSSDRLTVWFSAPSRAGVWSLGIADYVFADFLCAMQTRRTTH